MISVIVYADSFNESTPEYMEYKDGSRLLAIDVRAQLLIDRDYNQSENVNRVNFVENGNLTIAVYDFEVDGVDYRAVFVFDEDNMPVDKTYSVID